MLSEDERERFEASVRQVHAAVSRSVQHLSPSDARKVSLQQLYRGLGVVFEQAMQGDTLRPACESGCSACCHQEVSVTPIEAEALWCHLQANWSDHDVSRLLQSAMAQAQAQAHRSDLAWSEKPACVFLGADRLCAVYEIRPAACRKCHSLSRDACEARSENIPQNLKLLMDAEALIGGVRLTMDERGETQRVQPLPQALLDAWRRLAT